MAVFGAGLSIRQLCSAWKAAATVGGGIAIGSNTEQHRLLENGVAFHQLDYDDLRAAIVGLTETLLLPGLNTVIDRDHQFLWSWLAEVLLGRDGPLSLGTDRELSSLANVALRSALAGARPHTQDGVDRNRAAYDANDLNSRELLTHAHEALAYLAFPFLEGAARRACSAYVDLRGVVLQPFPGRSGSPYSLGRRCSNVADLLSLLEHSVAGQTLRSDLTEVLAHVHSMVPSATDGAAVVFEWRNSSLHGETSLPTIGGTVLSLALLISVDAIRIDYPTRRAAALERAVREVQRAQFLNRWDPSSWSYYPLYP